VKGEDWNAFRDRHGDWGRDLALWCARKHTGLTLRELGAKVGDLDYTGVFLAISRVEKLAKKNPDLHRAMKALNDICKM